MGVVKATAAGDDTGLCNCDGYGCSNDNWGGNVG